MLLIIIFILLLIIINTWPLIIYDYNSQIKYKEYFSLKKPFIINNFYNDDILDIFKPNNLLNKYGAPSGMSDATALRNLDLEISEYKKNEFFSIREFKLSMKDFINKNFVIDKNNKYQAKLYLDKNQVFDKMIKINTNKYFNNYTTDYLFWNLIYKKFRISLSPWDFPEHFDCVEQIGVLLYGNRQFYMDGQKYNLKAGDAIYIPTKANHYIKSTGSDFSIFVSLGFKPMPLFGTKKETETYNKCANEFNNIWPTQVKILQSGKF
jgi:mannose-6-phosphate isomerase-like protein (cupin superfamily)